MNTEKYQRAYFLPPQMSYDWVKKDYIDNAPIWCSVDLRDGNQALIEPMSLEEKLDFFKMLVDIGFKEIEVGFPAASDTEYNFMRALIERNMIPDDVTVQVLTQAREHIIKKTFDAVKGAPHAIIHLYNSTSVAQREQVFKKSKEEVKKLAVDGAQLLKKLAAETDGNFTFEYFFSTLKKADNNSLTPLSAVNRPAKTKIISLSGNSYCFLIFSRQQFFLEISNLFRSTPLALPFQITQLLSALYNFSSNEKFLIL